MLKVLLLFLALLSTDPREIAKINSLKKEAESSFKAGKYEDALAKFQLLDSLGVEDPALKLNLAHTYYQMNDTTGALNSYRSVLYAPDKKLRSVAYQQLGVMNKESGKYEEALTDLKSSIKADPTNEGARYDYELVKKLLDEQNKQDQQNQENDQNKENQENEDQQQEQENKEDQEKGEQNEEQQEQEGEKEESEENKDGEKKEGENEDGEEQEGEKEPSQEEMMQQKLEEMKISPEKAKMILEAMRNNEVQYLQQQRRKPTKRPPSGKPDW